MKKLLFSLLMLSAGGLFSSCEDSSKIPAPAFISVPLIFGKVSSDVKKSYFDYQRGRASANELPNLATPTRPVFEFTIDIPDQRDVKLKAVEVYKSFQRAGRLGPRVLVNSYSSFPATVSLTSQEALTGLQRILTSVGVTTVDNLLAASPGSRNLVLAGDAIVFTFEYVLEDGSRVILTPLTDVTLSNGTKVQVISGNQIVAPYAVFARFQTL